MKQFSPLTLEVAKILEVLEEYVKLHKEQIRVVCGADFVVTDDETDLLNRAEAILKEWGQI